MNENGIRLQKYLAQCGVASRRKSEEYIFAGKVTVNNEKEINPAYKVQLEDVVTYNGKILKLESEKVYIVFYKPLSCVTTSKEQFNRDSVMDYVNIKDKRVYPVGRLDYNTTGLLFLTNDGELTHALTHPAKQIEKTYVADVKGIVSNESMNALKNGVKLDDGYITRPAKVKLIRSKEGSSLIEIKIHEGKNRQVRRMFDAVGNSVISLKRTEIGEVNLGNLQPGEWKYIDEKKIKKLTGISKKK